jgi:hypothetical protein
MAFMVRIRSWRTRRQARRREQRNEKLIAQGERYAETHPTDQPAPDTGLPLIKGGPTGTGGAL